MNIGFWNNQLGERGTSLGLYNYALYNQILLGRSKFFPTNMYSTLAGFIEAGESAEEALLREIKEEVNITVTDIKYFQSQSWPFPSQLMFGYFCKYIKGEIKLNDGELEDAKWFELVSRQEKSGKKDSGNSTNSFNNKHRESSRRGENQSN